jgi:AmmeMemoRadiSam system protein B
MQDIRPSPIAGTWYIGNRESLAQAIDRRLRDSVVDPIPGSIVGVIAPHAGHRYSGQVAAHAFRCLEGMTPEIVVVVSPLHQLHRGLVLTSGHDAYATPLGNIPVDQELVKRFEAELASKKGLDVDRIKHDGEHSLEIELPFLQRVLPQPFRLLPLMIRDQSRSTVEAVGHTIGAILANQSAILVASTDLSHFHPQSIAELLDAEVLSRIEAFDPAGVLSAEEEGVGFACGRGAVSAVLWAAKDLGADQVKLLQYATSGDVTGDYNSVVGYAAAVIYCQAQD